MEQRNQTLRADVTAGRFLSDLRALRTGAGLDHGQLAARAHYPRDVIASAEAGPYLPALPVLAAYVRGCGGTGDEILAWEDRWRTVTGTKAHPLLSARVAGLSGANRPLSAEHSDPAAIRSALQRFGNRMSQPGSSPDAPRESAESPWEPAEAPREAPRPTAPNPVTQAAPATPAAPAAPAATSSKPAETSSRPAEGSSRPAEAPSAAKPPVAADAAAGPAPRGQHGRGSGGRSSRTVTIAAIAAALVILLIVILAL